MVMKNPWIAMMAFGLALGIASAQAEETKDSEKAEAAEEAKKQSSAMAKAKSTLADAVAKAVKANNGYRAVSAAAEIEGGAANADVGLVKGSSSKYVDEKL